MAEEIDRLKLQNDEFDALSRLAKKWDTLQKVPVVDDDYPEYRHYYESALHNFIAAIRANGRFDKESTSPSPKNKSTVDPFLWNFHTAIVEKTKQPGSLEDRRFLALALCGEAGELANIIKKEWRGDDDPEFLAKVSDELGDIYAYLRLNALAHGLDLDTIMETITIPKIRRRWG